MFMRSGSRPNPALRPAHSAIAPDDWAILADYWYPVAIAQQLTDRPMQADLLDVPLVLFRGRDGQVGVAVDICPHRLIRLSAGKVIDGEIECPFHGLRFDTGGRCQRVPALGREVRLPESYRLRSFPAREQYGLIWTCLGDPTRHAVPSFPSLSSADPAEFAYTEPVVWPISAPRQVENFVDLAHLPFVHATTLGGDSAAAVRPARIEVSDTGIISRAHFVETGPDGQPMPCDLLYRIVLPFAVEFRTAITAEPDRYIESCDIAAPISANRCKVFQVIKHPRGLEGALAMVEPLTVINEQDIAILGSLMVADLPLEQHHEIHLPVDNITGAYRSGLRALGLGGFQRQLACEEQL